MGKKQILRLVFCVFCLCGKHATTISLGQWDNFTDSSLSMNLWDGDWDKFDFDNEGIFSTSMVSNDTFGIRTNIIIDATVISEWRFQFKLNFETSSLNYVDLNLFDDSSRSASIFLRCGGSSDNFSLYSRLGQNAELLGASDKKTIDKSRNTIAVIASSDSIFVYYNNAKSENWEPILAVNYSWSSPTTYSGFLIRQSTSSFFGKHRIHFFKYVTRQADTRSPQVADIQTTTHQSIKVTFDEDIFISKKSSNQFAINSIPADSISAGDSVLYLHYPFIFDEQDMHINLGGVCDFDVNCLVDSIISFRYKKPKRAKLHDVVFTEIFADPIPVVGLPEFEYLEVLNRTDTTLNLEDWILTDLSKRVTLPKVKLDSGEYLILCEKKSALHFNFFGKTMAMESFPSLNNNGDTLLLISSLGDTIDITTYSIDNYGPSWKKDGGWSLELIDHTQVCLDSNWSVSLNPIGGTPGHLNSVDAIRIDTTPPRITRVELLTDSLVTIEFDQITDISNSEVLLDQNLKITAFASSNSQITVVLPNALKVNQVRQLNLNKIMDCVGNIMADTILFVALSSPPESGDIVINEVLFNPNVGVPKFIEIINRSQKIIDVQDLWLGRKEFDELIESIPLPYNFSPFFPGDILCITTDKQALISAYSTHRKEAIVDVDKIPSLYDREGNIGLFSADGNAIDWLQYSDEMHYKYIAQEEGVSLERIHPDIETSDVQNWSSASYSRGYATPGLPNSATINLIDLNNKLIVEPDPFTPNGDGYQDQIQIRIQSESRGANFQVVIYDINGREVSQLANLAYGGKDDLFLWDGTDNSGTIQAAGIYLVYVESLSASQKTVRIRKPVTLVWP